MEQSAKELAFERASELRDQIKALKKMIVFELWKPDICNFLAFENIIAFKQSGFKPCQTRA